MNQSLVRSRLTVAEAAAIRMVLDGPPSEHSRRAYERAPTDFFLWDGAQGRPALNKALVQRYTQTLARGGGLVVQHQPAALGHP